MYTVTPDQSPGTVKSSVLVTVHSAYLPTLVLPLFVSTITKFVLPLVMSSIQSVWFANVVRFVVDEYVPFATVVQLSRCIN